MFVDDLSFNAYKAVGFKSFQAKDAEGVTVSNADLSFKQWISYIGNFIKLSPVEGKFGEIPEGVLRLGGTFVVDGNDVKYQWSDRIPGDHPDITAVLEIAKNAAASKAT